MFYCFILTFRTLILNFNGLIFVFNFNQFFSNICSIDFDFTSQTIIVDPSKTQNETIIYHRGQIILKTDASYFYGSNAKDFLVVSKNSFEFNQTHYLLVDLNNETNLKVNITFFSWHIYSHFWERTEIYSEKTEKETYYKLKIEKLPNFEHYLDVYVENKNNSIDILGMEIKILDFLTFTCGTTDIEMTGIDFSYRRRRLIYTAGTNSTNCSNSMLSSAYNLFNVSNNFNTSYIGIPITKINLVDSIDLKTSNSTVYETRLEFFRFLDPSKTFQLVFEALSFLACLILTSVVSCLIWSFVRTKTSKKYNYIKL